MSLSKPKVNTTTIVIAAGTATLAALGFYAYYQHQQKQKQKPKVEKKTEKIIPKPQVLKDKGNDLFKKRQFSEALVCYNEAIQEALGNKTFENGSVKKPLDMTFLSQLYQNCAAVYEKMEDYKMVIEECNRALECNPMYVKALIRRAKGYMKTGFVSDGLEDVTIACYLEEYKNQSTVALADEMLKDLGQKDGMERAKNKKPRPPSRYVMESFFRSYYKDPISRAWKEYEFDEGDGLDDGAGDSLSPYEQAIRFVKQRKNFDRIIPLCTEEIETIEESKYIPEAYHLRGVFKYLFNYKYEEIVPDLVFVVNDERSTDLLKSYAYIKLGVFAALFLGNEDYIDSFEKAEELTPDNVDVFHQRGQVRVTKGDAEAAMLDFDRSSKLCPQFTATVAARFYIAYRHATVSGEEEKRQESAKKLQELAEKYDCPDIHSLYTQILLENGRYDEADVEFQKALKIDPSNANLYVHKAMGIFQKSQSIDETMSCLRKGLEVDPSNEFVLETIGTLYLQISKFQEAEKYISQALHYARSQNEMVMLCSLLRAAQVQIKVKAKLGIP